MAYLVGVQQSLGDLEQGGNGFFLFQCSFFGEGGVGGPVPKYGEETGEKARFSSFVDPFQNQEENREEREH